MRYGLASGWLQRTTPRPFPIGAQVVPAVDLYAWALWDVAEPNVSITPILTVGDYTPAGDVVTLAEDRSVFAIMPPDWLMRVQ